MSRPRTYGFRFSVVDGLFIAACAIGAFFIRSVPPMVWLIATAVGHFFLFCNITRIRRSFELIWTGIFIANVAIATWTDHFEWWIVLGIQLPVTAVLVFLELRSPRYHGIGAQKINAQLQAYLSHEID